MGCSFGFGLWAWPLEAHIIAVEVERPWKFMAKGLDFGIGLGRLTLYPVEGSTYYILLAIFSSFLWTLNKVWPLNPTASRLGRP